MRKCISLFLVLMLVISVCFAACKGKDKDKDKDKDNTESTITTKAPEGLEQFDTQYELTTDEDGNPILVVNGDDGLLHEVDEQGKETGRTFTTTTNASDSNNSGNSGNSDNSGGTPPVQKGPDDITNKTDDAKATTGKNLTTLPSEEDKVPKTTDKGTPVQFSDKDIATLTNMLEVPNLYVESFENSHRLPIDVATHVACWMAYRNSPNSKNFASATIVLDLFNYFAQTVVEFKTRCNGIDKSNITYSISNDTFAVKEYESATHTVQITEIEDLGNNNYYKVTANVKEINNSGCEYKKVVAVAQKNKLDTSLGFSIKALQWSK